MITCTRYHDFSAGHRVVGHENKCAYLHGHNYRVHFTCASPGLDEVGRVIDFGVIKSLLCRWVEQTWDHKFLLWIEDPILNLLKPWELGDDRHSVEAIVPDSLAVVDFNPTAENMARFLVEKFGPQQLSGTGVTLVRCQVDETRKCSAAYELPGDEWPQ